MLVNKFIGATLVMIGFTFILLSIVEYCLIHYKGNYYLPLLTATFLGLISTKLVIKIFQENSVQKNIDIKE